MACKYVRSAKGDQAAQGAWHASMSGVRKEIRLHSVHGMQVCQECKRRSGCTVCMACKYVRSVEGERDEPCFVEMADTAA